jgi:hypothetical protein
MPTCPECCSIDVEESLYSPEEKTDGQGYYWVVEHYYYCNDCGCEWTEKLETTREVIVEKHGKCAGE